MIVISNVFCVRVYRTKEDLTKFIEEHHFTFDNVFDSDKDNQQIY